MIAGMRPLTVWRAVLAVPVLLSVLDLAGRPQGMAGAGSAWTALASGTTAYLYDIDCPRTTTCLAVGDNGTVLATIDGGSHWTA